MDQKKLIKLGAILVSIGMFTGIWSAIALSETVVVAIPRQALAAHLNALSGGFWIILVALTFPFLSYEEKQKKCLSWAVLLATYGNWFITLVASLWGVRGINFNEDSHNNIIAVLLQGIVVLPSLWASVYWVRGLCSKR